MTDTDTEPSAALHNGNGGGAFSAEEEEERLKQRPADIDADVREMERRKRVEALMSSRLFREELERVLDAQMAEGGGAGPLLAQIREMVGAPAAGRLQAGAYKAGNCVLPINDIRGMEGMGYEKGEKILRCKLAAVYRLVDLFGWTQAGAAGQITARLNSPLEHFLTAPRGLLPHEVTASSLVKLDMQGAVQDQGTTNFPVNAPAFTLHSWVHAARPDVRCVLHLRSPAALAVSSMRSGLLPLSPESAMLGDVGYHQLSAGVVDPEERDKLVRSLGPSSKVLLLSNGGALCCGETLEEAFHAARCLATAADVQLRLAAVPTENLSLLSDEARKQIYDNSRRAPADGAKWRVGGEEFEALMRMLDNAGFRTGYIYRHPLVKGDVPKPRNDVECPPAVSSLGYLLEEEELYKTGLWKKIDGRKTGDRTRWLNSPNVYQKVEVLETGTTDPKKITKWVDSNDDEWVTDGSPGHSSTPVKIDAALQFVPKNTNPKEFKKLQQQIKDNRRADKISAGPQSHILEGVTWDEASKMAAGAEDAAATHTGDHVVLMGAASKGIIQRGYQHNATVYKAPYARNPFDAVTDDDINEYKRTIERKVRGEYDTDYSESEAQSGAQITSPASVPSETEEESRDEQHRILRIETKQAPRPSQPEVVLSDDSTADFLASERSTAERTPAKDLTNEVKKENVNLTKNQVHDRTVPTYDQVANPFSQTKPDHPGTHRRRSRKYSRSPTFATVLQVYESPSEDTKRADSEKSGPRCRISLKRFLDSTDKSDNFNVEYRDEELSGRTSKMSSYSMDWCPLKKLDTFESRSCDNLCGSTYSRRGEYGLGVYRSRSHAGLLNSFLPNPDPTHFHVPKCVSCGVYGSNYYIGRPASSCCDSARRRPNKCDEYGSSRSGFNNDFGYGGKVKVSETCVPVFNSLDSVFIQKQPSEAECEGNDKKTAVEPSEFCYTQEFSEDCYLQDYNDGEGSFVSENRTVIERNDSYVNVLNERLDEDVVEDGISPRQYAVFSDVLKELRDRFLLKIYIDKCDDALSNDGEYLNFSDDLEIDDAIASDYESPVRDLYVKDIRNYSVPMSVYYGDLVDGIVVKSPFNKSVEVFKAPSLEPILEEGKVDNEIPQTSPAEDREHSDGVNDIDVENIYEAIRKIVDGVIEQSLISIRSNLEVVVGNLSKIQERVADQVDAEHGSEDSSGDDTLETLTSEVKKGCAKRLSSNMAYRVMSAPPMLSLIAEDSKEDEVVTDESMPMADVPLALRRLSSSAKESSLDSVMEFESLEIVTEILHFVLDAILGQVSVTVSGELGLADESRAFDIAVIGKDDVIDLDDEVCDKTGGLVFGPKFHPEIGFETAHGLRRKALEGADDARYDLGEMPSPQSYDDENNNLFVNEVEAPMYSNFVSFSDLSGPINPFAVVNLAARFDGNLCEDVCVCKLAEQFLDLTLNRNENPECPLFHDSDALPENVRSVVDSVIGEDDDENTSQEAPDRTYSINDSIVPSDIAHCSLTSTSDDYIYDLSSLFDDNGARSSSRLEDSCFFEESGHNLDTSMDRAFVEEPSGVLGSDESSADTEDLDETDNPFKSKFDDLLFIDLRDDDRGHKRTLSRHESRYEQEDSILGSPFVKNAPVITMEHDTHKGGIKFWVSFDDCKSPRFGSSPPDVSRCRRRSLANPDDKIPTFYVNDFSPKLASSVGKRPGNENLSPTPKTLDLDLIEEEACQDNDIESNMERKLFNSPEQLDKFELPNNYYQKRKSIFCDDVLNEVSSDLHAGQRMNSEEDESYKSLDSASVRTSSAVSSSFASCSSPPSTSVPKCNLSELADRIMQLRIADEAKVDLEVERAAAEADKRLLLYDTKGSRFRSDLGTVFKRNGLHRKALSWPPFEETLFYHILTKFRMSRSFDPNDV